MPKQNNLKLRNVAVGRLPVLAIVWSLIIGFHCQAVSGQQTEPNIDETQSSFDTSTTGSVVRASGQPESGSTFVGDQSQLNQGSSSRPPADQVNQPEQAPPTQSPVADDPVQPSSFDGDAAWEHLRAVCKMGPRISTSDGMRQQQAYLKKHFESIGGKVLTQPFQATNPFNDQITTLHNIIVQFHPERERRLILCCHHDTRPFPDRDRRNPRGTFIGANDGGSGVAILCELGKHLEDMPGPYGIDLVFFDGEEFVIDQRTHPMFLGSTFFAQQYANNQIPWRYEYGILLDMVGDKSLQLYYEANSLRPGPDRLTRSIWGVAQRLGVKEFIPKERHVIKDDHLPLNSIARIPTCDIIDFDYPNPRAGNIYWHTTKDNIKNCSKQSLEKVGRVVLAWLREMQAANTSPQTQPTQQQ